MDASRYQRQRLQVLGNDPSYVDDVLCILHEDPTIALKQISKKFKLKEDKMDKPDIYLGGELSKMDNEEGECITPLRNGYKPELDATVELKADGLQWSQEIIESLRWAVELLKITQVDYCLIHRIQMLVRNGSRNMIGLTSTGMQKSLYLQTCLNL